MLPDPFHSDLRVGPSGQSALFTPMEEPLVTVAEGHKGGLSVALAWCVKENLAQSWMLPEFSHFAMVQRASAV